MDTHEQLDRPYESVAQSEVPPSGKNPKQSKHPLYERETLRFLQRALGGGTIIGITIGTILLWFLFQPAGHPMNGYLGEILGTIAILLFSCSLVIATKAPFLERFFYHLSPNWYIVIYLISTLGPMVHNEKGHFSPITSNTYAKFPHIETNHSLETLIPVEGPYQDSST